MKKNILWIFISIFAFFLTDETVFASSASVELKSDSTVFVGDKFDITMEVDAEEELSGIETYLSYDNEVGEFLSADDGIAGGKGLLRVNIRSFEEIQRKLTYKIKFLAKKAGKFSISFSDAVHLYEEDTDDEISVSSNDLELIVKNKREASSDSSLSIIKIAGGKLSPDFSKSVLDYTVDVGPDTDNIVVGVETSDANSDYSYQSDYGDKLKTGENKIKIIVKAEDGSKTTYNITVNKSEEKDVKKEEDTEAASGESVKTDSKDKTSAKSVISSTISEEPEYVPDPPEDNAQAETDIKDGKQTVIYVIIGAVIVLGFMLSLCIMLYKKSKINYEDED